MSIIQDLLAGLDELPVSEAELSEIGRLATAIEHALTVATEMPTTFDDRARELIVVKLQEAQHWSFELLRVGTRRSPRP